ncbi:hypothetical protein P7H22_11845 [Paenibacillus larvae]|nr:hypothetical protein [Paenibacillus larvae]MDT2240908.1 hypothetical protein [Paenibacillus larvae]
MRKRICKGLFINDERPLFCADDVEEQLTKYFIQVDIWLKGDYTENRETSIKQKMQELGATWTSAFGFYAPTYRCIKSLAFCDEVVRSGRFICKWQQLWEYRLG